MGFYSQVIFPRLCDLLLNRPFVANHRKQLLATACGEVLEVGFGTGLNLPHYPVQIKRITTVDPSAGMHRLAQRRSLDREQPIVPAVLADHSSMELAAQLLDQEQTPASAAIQRELQRRLDSAIAELDDDDREIVLMRHREQLSNQQVAEALGLSEAAASMRYLRAIRRLRANLLPAGGAQES